jgi:hypothetical protein
MAIDEDTKSKIIDLHLNQHKAIRQIAKIVKKSSRDVNAVVKEDKQKLGVSNHSKQGDSINDNRNQEKEEPSNYPVNAKAYRLFAQGLTPLQVTIELGLLEADATKYYLEYTRLLDLAKLPQILRILGNVRAVNYFLKLSNLALAEGLTTEEVVHLVNIVDNNSISSVLKRIEEIKRMLSCLETELDERKDLLNDFNKKTKSAESNLAIMKKACKETRDEFIRLYNEKNSLEKWVFEFKHNNDKYLEVQNEVKEKVEAFLTKYNGRKLLEFSLTAAVEALRNEQERELLTEKISPLKNYDFDPEILFFPNPYNYCDVEKEKLFELASKTYDKLVKGLTDVVISTAAGFMPSTPS